MLGYIAAMAKNLASPHSCHVVLFELPKSEKPCPILYSIYEKRYRLPPRIDGRCHAYPTKRAPPLIQCYSILGIMSPKSPPDQ